MNDLTAVEYRKPESDHQRVRRILRQDAESSGAVISDLDREACLDQDVVKAHAFRLVTDREENPQWLGHTVRVQLGDEFSLDARCGRTRTASTLEVRVWNCFVCGRVAF